MYRRGRGFRGAEDWRRMPPYLKAVIVGSAAVGGLYVVSHVETMPLNGRRRLMFLSPAHEEQLGEQAYREILSSSRLLPPAHPMSRAVARVGHKIAEETDAPFMKWKFHVIEAKEPNAFCLPGGKVFVHSGLFKVLRNEDALAAVMFHEAAHGLARHGAEKISFSLLVYGLLALIFPDYGQISDLMVKLAVDLPFSRKLELEADSIGLRLMAQACYDPRASIQMNTSLGQLDKGSQLKYFSTHPPSAERVQALREQLRAALEVYESSDCGSRKQAFARAMKPAFSPEGAAVLDCTTVISAAETTHEGILYCSVEGTLPSSTSCQVMRPVRTWTQRYMQVGCGGLCGMIRMQVNAASGSQQVNGSEFVLAATDMGGAMDGKPFAHNPGRRKSFAYSAQLLTALVSKTLIQAYYAQESRYSYFNGCSDGGREGIMEAIRYPGDFDGILARAPAMLFQFHIAASIIVERPRRKRGVFTCSCLGLGQIRG